MTEQVPRQARGKHAAEDARHSRCPRVGIERVEQQDGDRRHAAVGDPSPSDFLDAQTYQLGKLKVNGGYYLAEYPNMYRIARITPENNR